MNLTKHLSPAQINIYTLLLICARLVSSGQDMVLDTDENDSEAQNDDLMLEIGIGELNHFKLYSGSEITTQTRAYNSAIVSDTEP
ncbi:MAG: hypothetical protein ABGW74_04295, partial [Campylobacterales bacterium]